MPRQPPHSNAVDDDLPVRFFGAARNVLVGDSDRLDFEVYDLLAIVENPALRARFQTLYRELAQNPELGVLVREFLEDVATDLEDKAKVTDIKVDLLDRAGLAVAASVTAAGIAAIIATGGTVGAIILLSGGLIGMGSAGTGRTIMKLGGQRDVSAAQKIRRLVNNLSNQ